MESQYVESRISRHLHYRAKAAGMPLSGTFELTPCCNLSCKMCYVRKSMGEVQTEGGLMSAEEWIELGRKARDRGMLYLLLTGGEPLSRPDFREIYTALRRLGLVVSVNTNGTLIDDEMVEFFAADPPSKINMSLYGSSRETYKELCGVPEAFDRAMYAVEKLRSRGITVKINYSVTRYNLPDFDGIFAAAEENGCHVQLASYMFPPLRRDENSVGQNDRLTPEESAAVSLYAEKRRMSEEEYLERCRMRAEKCGGIDCDECRDEPSEHIGCRAGSTAFWIDWNGGMSACGMMPLTAANVREVGFDAAWAAVRSATQEILLPPKCTACASRDVCMMCAASCYCETGSFSKEPKYLCRRTEELIRLSAEEIVKRREENESKS